jgi:hypothetical protein
MNAPDRHDSGVQRRTRWSSVDGFEQSSDPNGRKEFPPDLDLY